MTVVQGVCAKITYHCRTCQFDWTGPLTPPEEAEGGN